MTNTRYTEEIRQKMTATEVQAEIASLEKVVDRQVTIPGYSRLFALNDIQVLQSWV